MANEGKFVRPTGSLSSDEDENLTSDESDRQTSSSEAMDNRNTQSVHSDTSSYTGSEADDSEIDMTNIPTLPSNASLVDNPVPDGASIENTGQEQVRNAERMDRMEKMIADLSCALNRFKPNQNPTWNVHTDNNWNLVRDDNPNANVGEASLTRSQPNQRKTYSENPENSWGLSRDVNSDQSAGGATSSSIRWDYVKSFPSGIAANKMWEEWNRYIENFEIAASLSNVSNPAKRTQLLFLSVGNELQEIIRAAKLRPNLTNPDCYMTFVANIKKYFRSMTDTAAEHEAFSKMKQEDGEAAVAFHARLMCKVRSCNYSADDEDRFVRAQLLSGLRNRELVKQARTYGYETNFIVQSATRDEAFEAETRQHTYSAYEVNRIYDRNRNKRFAADHRRDEPTIKRRRSNEPNQRSQEQHQRRCTRCFLFRHRNGMCPALGRSCNRCGKRGHFVAACRQKQVNTMQRERNDRSVDRVALPNEDMYEDNKQVLTN